MKQITKDKYINYMDSLLTRDYKILATQLRAFMKDKEDVSIINMVQDSLSNLKQNIHLKQVAEVSTKKQYMYFIDPHTKSVNRITPSTKDIEKACNAIPKQPYNFPNGIDFPQDIEEENEKETDSTKPAYVG